MHPALWISKTGLDAQQTDISVISNNVANASTIGYKKTRAVLKTCCIRQLTRQVGSVLQYQVAQWPEHWRRYQGGGDPEDVYPGQYVDHG